MPFAREMKKMASVNWRLNKMLFFNACVKCVTGTVKDGSDEWGAYIRCINCGNTVNLPRSVRTGRQIAEFVQETNQDESLATPAIAA